MAAIRFLTTVARSVHCTLFADPSVLKQICESIILPNLRVSGAMRQQHRRGEQQGMVTSSGLGPSRLSCNSEAGAWKAAQTFMRIQGTQT